MHPKEKQAHLETISSSMKTQPDNENLEDRISRLHESVLSKILSKLPTIDAVMTCVLSKSWKTMWKNITDLRFDELRMRNKKDCQFLEFVDRVLLDIGNPNINSFQIRSINFHDPDLLISWLPKFIQCNLQILDISWCTREAVLFSPFFASFGSLVELRLRIDSILEISAPVFLQNLKFFSFEIASFVNKSPVSKDLLLKFPVLETFIASNCYFIDTNTVILDSPLLKVFKNINCVSIQNPGGFFKLCKIRILASKLENVTFSGGHYNNFLLDFPPSLPNAHLSLRTSKWPKKFLQCFTSMMSLYLEVKYLEFEISEIPFLVLDEENKVPNFRHLIKLKLVYDMTQHFAFTMFLKSTPILEKLSICDADPHLKRSLKTLRTLFSETAPDCVQTTLKVLKIKNFKTNDIQMAVLKYLMENAKNLKSVTLYTRRPIKERRRALILSYPKASPHAYVLFETSI